MSITHTYTLALSRSSGAPVSKTITATGGLEVTVSETIPASSTDLEIAFALDVSACQGIYIVADAAMTIEWNDGSGTQGSFTLAADTPEVFWGGEGQTCPFDVDVTSIFVTSSAGGLLEIYAIVDGTP